MHNTKFCLENYTEERNVGLAPNKVDLYEYRSEWKTDYLQEEERLKEIFEGYYVDIQHVGSTSIPGMCAKPIIDIVVGLIRLGDGERFIATMEKFGYHYKGHTGISNRYFFSKGRVDYRTHHIHLVQYKDENWMNQIVFRDYLKNHPKSVEEYTRIKCDLQVKYMNDREMYTNLKSRFIREIIEIGKSEGTHKTGLGSQKESNNMDHACP